MTDDKDTGLKPAPGKPVESGDSDRPLTSLPLGDVVRTKDDKDTLNFPSGKPEQPKPVQQVDTKNEPSGS
jgi:hypothetical protein